MNASSLSRSRWMSGPAALMVIVAGVLFADSAVWAAGEDQATSLLGRRIGEFALKDFRGHQHSLTLDYDPCPICNKRNNTK